jgi:DNA ligase-1
MKTSLADGYEGVMIRSLDGPYKCGRATHREKYLTKIKRFDPSTAEIIGYEPLYHNDNPAEKDNFGRTKRSSHQDNKIAIELFGKFILRDIETGIEFSCGTGMTHSQREQFWADRDSLVGQYVEYKSFNIGVLEKPRHPVFLRLRNSDDVGEPA